MRGSKSPNSAFELVSGGGIKVISKWKALVEQKDIKSHLLARVPDASQRSGYVSVRGTKARVIRYVLGFSKLYCRSLTCIVFQNLILRVPTAQWRHFGSEAFWTNLKMSNFSRF